MLTTVTKHFSALVRVRAQVCSPYIYPALSRAGQITTRHFSSLAKKLTPIVETPRPMPELQSWNVHGMPHNTNLGEKQAQMTQLQSWNHHSPLPELSGPVRMKPGDRFYYPQNASDLIPNAVELERQNMEAEAVQDEIIASTGGGHGAIKVNQLYYPQDASDLLPNAFEMERMNETAAAHSSVKASKIHVSPDVPLPKLNQFKEILDQVYYPQDASDLLPNAVEMERQNQGASAGSVVGASEMTPKPPSPNFNQVDYPQGASDLLPNSVEMERQNEGPPAVRAVGASKMTATPLTKTNKFQEIFDQVYYPQDASDLLPNAVEMQRQNEGGFTDSAVCASKMTAKPSPKIDQTAKPSPKIDQVYYPQDASDLLPNALELERQNEGASRSTARSAKPSSKPQVRPPQRPQPSRVYYPQDASDLLPNAKQMEEQNKA